MATAEVTPVVEPVVESPKLDTPQVFKARREIQPKDKDGNALGAPHVYEAEGATQVEADQKVADKMAEAISNGTLKIRELNLRVKNGGIEAPKIPEGAEVNDYSLPEPKPRQLTDDEKFQLAQDLNNPAKMEDAYDRLYEARTGMKPMDDAKSRAQETQRSIKLAAVAEAEAFSRDTPEFYGCPENRTAMLDFMVSRNLKWTAKNLKIAFREMTAEGLLVAAPVEVVKEVVEVPAPPRTEARVEPVVEERKPDRFPSAIRPSQASATETKPKPKGPSAKEIAMMTPDQYRTYMESQGLWGK